MTLEEGLMKFWKEHDLPGGPQIEHDNQGQIVIYTGMMEGLDGNLTELVINDEVEDEGG